MEISVKMPHVRIGEHCRFSSSFFELRGLSSFRFSHTERSSHFFSFLLSDFLGSSRPDPAELTAFHIISFTEISPTQPFKNFQSRKVTFGWVWLTLSGSCSLPARQVDKVFFRTLLQLGWLRKIFALNPGPDPKLANRLDIRNFVFADIKSYWKIFPKYFQYQHFCKIAKL